MYGIGRKAFLGPLPRAGRQSVPELPRVIQYQPGAIAVAVSYYFDGLVAKYTQPSYVLAPKFIRATALAFTLQPRWSAGRVQQQMKILQKRDNLFPRCIGLTTSNVLARLAQVVSDRLSRNH